MATSVIWPPRYYFLLLRAPFFGCLAKTTIHFLVKKPSLIGPISFGPIGDCINGVPLYISNPTRAHEGAIGCCWPNLCSRHRYIGEGDWGERVRDTCYKDPLLFISADVGIPKFLIGWAVMSNLLTCIISKKQPWCSIKGNVFHWLSLLA